MVLIPAGEFVMGSNKIDTAGEAREFGTVKPLYLDEHPERRISLPDYYIDKYEVTNVAYGVFVRETSARAPAGWKPGILLGQEHHPVTGINWYDAERYCRWGGKRLATEAEWEKAARGTDGREYPWGNKYDGKRANTGDAGRGGLVKIGSFPQGASPFGVHDLTGNAWEWVDAWYQAYPGSDFDSPLFGEKFKVIRGMSWGGSGHYAIPHFYRAAYRSYARPETSFPDVGFRCAKNR